MKIKNPTHWKTQDIAKLIYRVAKDELDRGQLKRARVKIAYARSNYLSGECTYGTPLQPRVWMTLRLPRPGKQVDVVSVAKIIAHELGHSKGIKHSDMHNTRYGWVDGWREYYAWATEYEIGTKSEKSRDEKLAERRTKAVVKAQKMVRKWETAAKRANTMLKKWQVRLKSASLRTTLLSVSTTIPPADSNLEAGRDADRIPSPVS